MILIRCRQELTIAIRGAAQKDLIYFLSFVFVQLAIIFAKEQARLAAPHFASWYDEESHLSANQRSGNYHLPELVGPCSLVFDSVFSDERFI